MAIDTNVVTAAATATLLASPATVGSAAVGSSGKSRVTVANPVGATSTVFLGGATVTASGAKQGIPLLAGAFYSIDLAYDDLLYGIVASGTQAVNVLNAMADNDA